MTENVGYGEGGSERGDSQTQSATNVYGEPVQQTNANAGEDQRQPSPGDVRTQTSSGNGITWAPPSSSKAKNADDAELTPKQKWTIDDQYSKATLLWGPRSIAMDFANQGDPEKAFAGLATDLLLFAPNLLAKILERHAQYKTNLKEVLDKQYEKEQKERAENMALIADMRGYKKKDIVTHIHADMIEAGGDINKMAGNFKAKIDSSDQERANWQRDINDWNNMDPEVAKTLQYVQSATPDENGRIQLNDQQRAALLKYSLQKNAQKVYGMDVQQKELDAYIKQAEMFTAMGMYKELQREQQQGQSNSQNGNQQAPMAKDPHEVELDQRRDQLTRIRELKGHSQGQVDLFMFQDFVADNKDINKLREKVKNYGATEHVEENDAGQQVSLKSVFENLAELRQQNDLSDEDKPAYEAQKEQIKTDLRNQVKGTSYEKIIDLMITRAEKVPMEKDEDGNAISPYDPKSEGMNQILEDLHIAERHKQYYGVKAEEKDLEIHEQNLQAQDFSVISQTNWQQLLINPNGNQQQGGVDWDNWWTENREQVLNAVEERAKQGARQGAEEALQSNPHNMNAQQVTQALNAAEQARQDREKAERERAEKERELEEAQRQIQANNDEIERLKNAETDDDRVKALQEENKDLEGQVNNLRVEKDAADRKLATAQQETQDAKDEAQTAKEGQRAAQQELEEMRAEVARQRAENERLQKENEDLRKAGKNERLADAEGEVIEGDFKDPDKQDQKGRKQLAEENQQPEGVVLTDNMQDIRVDGTSTVPTNDSITIDGERPADTTVISSDQMGIPADQQQPAPGAPKVETLQPEIPEVPTAGQAQHAPQPINAERSTPEVTNAEQPAPQPTNAEPQATATNDVTPPTHLRPAEMPTNPIQLPNVSSIDDMSKSAEQREEERKKTQSLQAAAASLSDQQPAPGEVNDLNTKTQAVKKQEEDIKSNGATLEQLRNNGANGNPAPQKENPKQIIPGQENDDR